MIEKNKNPIKETVEVVSKVTITIDFVKPEEAKKILEVARERKEFYRKMLKL